MSHDIDDEFDDEFEIDDDSEVLETDTKTKPLEKRLKIDALLEEQRLRLKKLKKALEEDDDFAEFDDEFDDDF